VSGGAAEASFFASVEALEPHRIWDGVVGRTVHAERVTMSLIELEPDAVVPEHGHEQEQVGLLLEGSMTFCIGGETRELGPGGTWRIPGHVPHSVAAGPDGAVAFEVFAPIRDDWHDHEREEPSPPRWPPRG
jgi:quercetin dioxygenase-like cupin family protein